MKRRIVNQRMVALAGTAVAAIVLGVASFAWACTNFARVDAINPPADAARSEVTVRGAGAPPHAPVELRWNAIDGRLLGVDQADDDGNFTVRGTVPPDAEPGTYSVIARARDVGVGRIAFEVTAPSANPVAASAVGSSPGPDSRLWSGFGSSSPRLDSPAAGPDLALVGIGVLGVGLVALTSGAAVATARRRRATATSAERP